jgi:phosphoglycolate phosphatase
LDKAVYVGDIQGDYDSSVEAGIKFIHAAYGFGTINAPVPKIEAFSELPQIISQVI